MAYIQEEFLRPRRRFRTGAGFLTRKRDFVVEWKYLAPRWGSYTQAASSASRRIASKRDIPGHGTLRLWFSFIITGHIDLHSDSACLRLVTRLTQAVLRYLSPQCRSRFHQSSIAERNPDLYPMHIITEVRSILLERCIVLSSPRHIGSRTQSFSDCP